MINTLKKYFPMSMNFARRCLNFQKNYAIGNQQDQEKQIVDFIENRILMDKNPLIFS